MKIYRSILFAPGNRIRMLEKVGKSGADAVVLDLEDAIPSDQKNVARSIVNKASKKIAKEDDIDVYVRLNPFTDETGLVVPCGEEDLREVVSENIKGIMIPKIENAKDIVMVHRILIELEKSIGLMVGQVDLVGIVETVLGVENVFDIASVEIGNRNLTLAFGAGDYTNDLNIEWPKDEFNLDYPRTRIASACRVSNLSKPIDTVWIDLDDEHGLRESCKRAKNLGFFGKLCIHPKQVEIVNQVFTPSRVEYERAVKIKQVFDEAKKKGEGSTSVNGKMIDAPIVFAADKVIALKDVFGVRE